VVVLDIAFAGMGGSGGFEQVTLPFITRLGPRLARWVDHHDHEAHARYAGDSRFVLAKKSEHGACPEMVTPELVSETGPVDTILCHTDFDGLASAAKWLRGGLEPYPGADDDARAIDTRLGTPSPFAAMADRALRARPHDAALFGLLVRHLESGLSDPALDQELRRVAALLEPIEAATRRAAERYRRVPPGVAWVDIADSKERVDKTLLLLLGQEREPVSVVVDESNISVAARFDSGWNFVELFGLAGGMPTRVSVPRGKLALVLSALGVSAHDIDGQ
jgi:hypothetical protein